jgi:hypothetical protein
LSDGMTSRGDDSTNHSVQAKRDEACPNPVESVDVKRVLGFQ